MPTTTTEEGEEAKRLERQRKLGAAFLAHQVSELEKSVDTLTFSRNHYQPRSGSGKPKSRGVNSSGGGGRLKPIRVVDASTLVHALPVLKRWLREDKFQLIVPLSALATLDILKKSPPPLQDQAREATRFLETQFNIVKQILSVWGPVGTRESDSRIRLRAQSSTEELSWKQVENLFKISENFKIELPKDENGQPILLQQEEQEGEGSGEPLPLPLPTANDIPRTIRSTLQCFLYFHQKHHSSSSTSPPPTVALYNSLHPVPPPIPSSLLSLLPKPSTSSTSSSSTIDFLSISSGDTLNYYLENFFFPPSSPSPLESSNSNTSSNTSNQVITLISSSQVVAAKEWFKKLAAVAQKEKEKEKNNNNNSGGGGSAGGNTSNNNNNNNNNNNKYKGKGRVIEGGGGGKENGRNNQKVGESGEEIKSKRTLFVP
ncbi:hypothetical protein JCM3765_002701 [Sporobolomyces pararoseus]